MNSGPILTASKIAKSYRMGDSDLHILKGLDLTVAAGEFVAIEGRSGSGKSTLLHILGALESVSDGKTQFKDRDYTMKQPSAARGFLGWYIRWRVLLVLILGLVLTFASALLARNYFIAREQAIEQAAMKSFSDPSVVVPTEISSDTVATLQRFFNSVQILFFALIALWLVLVLYRLWSTHEYRRRQNSAAALRRRQFGFIFQFYHLLPELNVLENVVFPGMVDAGFLNYFSTRSELRRRATEILTELGMSHRLKHKPSQLSGGERQRVAIARALMNSPLVLFADEPTGNLDAETGKQIMSLLEHLHQKKGQTIVMVTHDRSIARQADRVVVMADGRLHAVS